MADPMTTGIASAGGSIVAYSLISCWRRHKDKTKVRGALLPIGKSYAEKNLIEDNNTIFFDLDGSLSETPIREIEKSKVRLELYPKASQKVKELKSQQKNKVIVVMSESYELLQHVGILEKHIKAYLPTQKFFADNSNLPQHLEKCRMTMEIAVPNKARVYYNTYDDLSNKLADKYCKSRK
jgi:hypothetical protein